jgi:BlaI family transcriptional regulator, penicillinase repressor
MSDPFSGKLSKRERQIMEAVFRLRTAAVSDVRGSLADAPSYSAVRTTMNILVRKGFLETKEEGRRYLYSAVVRQELARRTAARHLLKTYFDGSIRDAVMGLIDADARLSPKDYRELIAMIRGAWRREGKGRK